MNIRGSVLYFVLFFAMNNQSCFCNRCNGALLKCRDTRRLHKAAFGLSSAFFNPPAAGAFDAEMEGDGDDEGPGDEEDAREREFREALLRELRQESSDDEMPDAQPTPPTSETGGDLQEEERPPARIDGGHVGLDEDMDKDTGLLAKDLEDDAVRLIMIDWLDSASTGMLVSLLLLCVWFLYHGVA
jgi:hypothetical protein